MLFENLSELDGTRGSSSYCCWKSDRRICPRKYRTGLSYRYLSCFLLLILANIDPADFNEASTCINKLPLGVYYGFSLLHTEPSAQLMVMSLGTNPHYQNKEVSLEVHILKKYPEKFYGHRLAISIVGWIREMQSFESLGTSKCLKMSH